MKELIIGALTGLLGHQTDRIIRNIEARGTPPTWTLLSRYGIGYLLTLAVFALMTRRQAWRDEALLLFLAAGVSVGVGVGVGHALDDMRE